MGIATLILLFCLSDGSNCQYIRIPQEHIMSCMLSGQVEANKWLLDHEGYKLISYKCEINSRI